ncbi:hypothetical protein DFH11DRAFT_1724676 [Phellopilus nigrolimitatus]|nr:hypothetical protein DFH11DRAFT_1724676 [Phellopilus nigrolimitatus]
MLEHRLRLYLWWKARLAVGLRDGSGGRTSQMPIPRSEDAAAAVREDRSVGEALRKKDALRAEWSAGRRRVLDGAHAPAAATPGNQSGDSVVAAPARESGMSAKERERLGILVGEGAMRVEADSIAEFLATQDGVLNLIDDEDEGDDAVAEGLGVQPFGGATERPSIDVDAEIALALSTGDAEADIDPNYGLQAPQQTVPLRAYSDDTDDQVLEELRPRFIIMYEPNQDFVQRIEEVLGNEPGKAC